MSEKEKVSEEILVLLRSTVSKVCDKLYSKAVNVDYNDLDHKNQAIFTELFRRVNQDTIKEGKEFPGFKTEIYTSFLGDSSLWESKEKSFVFSLVTLFEVKRKLLAFPVSDGYVQADIDFHFETKDGMEYELASLKIDLNVGLKEKDLEVISKDDILKAIKDGVKKKDIKLIVE